MLEVVMILEKYNYMVYIELKNVSNECERLSLTEKLRMTGTTIDSLKVEEDIINRIKDGWRRRRASEL